MDQLADNIVSILINLKLTVEIHFHVKNIFFIMSNLNNYLHYISLFAQSSIGKRFFFMFQFLLSITTWIQFRVKISGINNKYY